MTVTDILVQHQKDIQDLKGVKTGGAGALQITVPTFLDDINFTDEITGKTRGIGNSFVLGHSTNGVLGITTPQIVLGSGTVGAFTSGAFSEA